MFISGMIVGVLATYTVSSVVGLILAVYLKNSEVQD